MSEELKQLSDRWAKLENKDECRQIIVDASIIISDGLITLQEIQSIIHKHSEQFPNNIILKLPFLGRRQNAKICSYIFCNRHHVEKLKHAYEILGIENKTRKTVEDILVLSAKLFKGK